MRTHFQTIKLSNHDLAGHDAPQFELLYGWPRFLDLLRSQLTLAILATLITLSLMLVFHQIVLGAVAQGELRQQARTLQSQALWRCNSSPDTHGRDNCLRQVKAMDGAEASL